LIRVSGGAHEHTIWNPQDFRRIDQLAIPICLFPNVVPVLVYLAVNWEGVLPVGVGVGQHDHVALSKKVHRFVTRGSKDTIYSMAEQALDIQISVKPFNGE
jgi:hypothetical protein